MASDKWECHRCEHAYSHILAIEQAVQMLPYQFAIWMSTLFLAAEKGHKAVYPTVGCRDSPGDHNFSLGRRFCEQCGFQNSEQKRGAVASRSLGLLVSRMLWNAMVV